MKGAWARIIIEIDQEALAMAAEVLGTLTPDDTVNAALREVAQGLTQVRSGAVTPLRDQAGERAR